MAKDRVSINMKDYELKILKGIKILERYNNDNMVNYFDGYLSICYETLRKISFLFLL